MDASLYLPLLSLFTLGAVIVFAIVSVRAVRQRRRDDDTRKSTLAADKNSKGKPADV